MNPVLDTIMRRKSVRKYEQRNLEQKDLEQIYKALEEVQSGPFSTNPHFILVENQKSFKIETYGNIRGNCSFVIGTVRDTPLAAEDFGFEMEGIVLKATYAGLSTCWIGGIFNRKSISKYLDIPADEKPLAMIATGYANQKIPDSGLIHNRKPWDELFFKNDFNHPLLKNEATIFELVLEAVRAAPSASNKQPWRILILDDNIHLYMSENRLYNSIIPDVPLQNIDMGIAMKHFEEAAHSLGIKGCWKKLDSAPCKAKQPLKYIASWISL